MARVTLPGIGSIGLIRDQQPQELPLAALTDIQNIRMRDGSAERIAGHTAVFNTPPLVPYWLNIYNTASSRFVVYAGTNAVHVDDGTTRTDITGTAPTGGAGDRWTGGILNGVLILNNYVDQPMFWGGDTGLNLATLTAWNSNWRAYAMRPFRNYLIALNVKKSSTFYPSMVKWSSAADPGAVPASWDETDPAVDAGETDLSETGGTIVDGLAMNDTFIIYKTDSMYAMNYIGGQYIWQFRKLPGDVGLLARNCVCNIPSGHLLLTVGDVVTHNGNGPQSILTGRLRKWLFERIDETYSDRSFCVSNPALNEAWICFPETGSEVCTKALIWNYADNTFGLRDLDDVTCGVSGQYRFVSTDPWSGDSAAWSADGTTWDASDIAVTQSRFLLGNDTPELLGVDVGTSFDGAAYTAKVERKGLTFDAPEQVKLVKAVLPRIEGTTGGVVYIQVGATMDVESDYAWGDPITYTIGTTYRADLMMNGRFIAYRVYSTAAMEWRIKSIDFDVERLGMH